MKFRHLCALLHCFTSLLTELSKWYVWLGENKTVIIVFLVSFQFDSKQKRTFLKRSFCDTDSEMDLYIGNTITVFGRDLKLIEYMNDITKNELMKKSERFVIEMLFFALHF